MVNVVSVCMCLGVCGVCGVWCVVWCGVVCVCVYVCVCEFSGKCSLTYFLSIVLKISKEKKLEIRFVHNLELREGLKK